MGPNTGTPSPVVSPNKQLSGTTGFVALIIIVAIVALAFSLLYTDSTSSGTASPVSGTENSSQDGLNNEGAKDPTVVTANFNIPNGPITSQEGVRLLNEVYAAIESGAVSKEEGEAVVREITKRLPPPPAPPLPPTVP